MYIEGVNPDLYISDPSQLKVGMELWHVGQGGIGIISKPSMVGTVVGIHQGRSCDNVIADKKGWFTYNHAGLGWVVDDSMTDNHILPQTYNNYYYCSSEENALKIYEFLTDVWNSDPRYEEDRQEKILDGREWDSMDSYDYDDYDDWNRTDD